MVLFKIFYFVFYLLCWLCLSIIIIVRCSGWYKRRIVIVDGDKIVLYVLNLKLYDVMKFKLNEFEFVRFIIEIVLVGIFILSGVLVFGVNLKKGRWVIFLKRIL